MSAPAQAGLQFFGGLQARAAARSDAKAHEYRAKALATQAKSKSAHHRRSLNEALSTIEALRGSSNVSGRGATAMAISREQRRRSKLNENSDVLETRFGIVNARTQAAGARARGTAALVQGTARALGTLNEAYG
jgi:hypothetical protein